MYAEKQEIEKLRYLSKNEKNVKQKRRYDSVLLCMEGYTEKETSEILHISLRTVNGNVSLYKKGGTDALLIKKQPGTPKKLTAEQEKELYDMIATKTPEEAGIGVFANWTAPLACQIVKKRFGVTFSERGMRNLFERIGLSYTRPTYTLKNADLQKQEAFQKQFEELKKTSES